MKKEKVVHIDDQFAIRFFGNNEPEFRLICFASSGGQSTQYRNMAKHLPETWQICAVDLPGHGFSKGLLVQDIDTLLKIILPGLDGFLDRPYSFFGHSMGGSVAFMLTIEIEKEKNLRSPEALFISASMAPSLMDEIINKYPIDTDDNMINELLVATDERFQSTVNSPFFFFYKPLYYADYRVIESIKLKEQDSVETPVKVFYSTEDKIINIDRIKDWSNYTGEIDYYQFTGSHDYIRTNARAVMTKVINCIENTYNKN